jgi:hypothetical protein
MPHKILGGLRRYEPEAHLGIDTEMCTCGVIDATRDKNRSPFIEADEATIKQTVEVGRQ